MTSAQQTNLSELVATLAKDTELSAELADLVNKGLHHVHLPPTLQPKAAEALQLSFEGMGGLPRLLLWADAHPAAFYKLFARMVIPTINPVIPPTATPTAAEWPEWLTARRLAYQEAGLTPIPPEDESESPG